MRVAGRIAILGALLFVPIGAAACGSPPSPAAVSGPAFDQKAQANGFVLEVQLSGTTYSAATAIPLATTLTWTGPDEHMVLWGSGMGPVSFTYTELTGARRSIGGVMTADCAPHDFQRGTAHSYPPGKSWAASHDDPNFAFFSAWGQDPELHLPAGDWRIDVLVAASMNACNGGAGAVSMTIPVPVSIR